MKLSPLRRILQFCRVNWEALFFLVLSMILCLQNLSFHSDLRELSLVHQWMARYIRFNAFILKYSVPISVFLSFFFRGSFFKGVFVCHWSAVLRFSWNALVFDAGNSHFIIITQLIFFLPYTLMTWGWIYWRIDQFGERRGRLFFRLDHEDVSPRPIDYFVASFSSVFSASISNIKGLCARSRILILLHGFMIYDIMGLTLSRAVALVQR